MPETTPPQKTPKELIVERRRAEAEVELLQQEQARIELELTRLPPAPRRAAAPSDREASRAQSARTRLTQMKTELGSRLTEAKSKALEKKNEHEEGIAAWERHHDDLLQEEEALNEERIRLRGRKL